MTMQAHTYTKLVAKATDPDADTAGFIEHGRRYGPNRAGHRALHASARSNGRRAVRQVAPRANKPPPRPPAPPPPLPRCHRAQAYRASKDMGGDDDAR